MTNREARTQVDILVARIVRTIPVLQSQALRMAWLRDVLAVAPVSTAAAALDVVCVASDGGDPACREVLVSLAGMLQDPASRNLAEGLRAAVGPDAMSPLARVLHGRLPQSTTRRKGTRGSNEEEHKVPDYGRGRPLTLGERKSLARRPTRKLLDKLLADPHPHVIRNLLDNPITTEDDIVRLAARRPPTAHALFEIVRHPRWNVRSRVRMALLLNPGCPAEIGVPLIGLVTLSDLRTIVEASDLNVAIHDAAVERLRKPVPVVGYELPLDDESDLN